MKNGTYSRRSQTVSTVKKSQAMIPAACWRRNARQVPFALGGAGALPLQATFGAVQFAGHRTSWLVPVVGLSLVAAVISYVAGIGAARILGARLSSFVGLTEVMFAVLVAWLVLGELPTAVQLLGGAFIVIGVALVRVDELRSPRTRRVPART
jgi:drug/metabolite transporter (DMT)-like permease